MSARKLGLLCACLALASGPLPPGRAQNKPLDQRIIKVLSDWEKRKNNATSVRYVLHGELVIPKGCNTDDFGNPLVPATPGHDISRPCNTIFLFDFSTGRFRIESSRQSYSSRTEQSYPIVSHACFNGSVVRVENPREANTSSVHSPGPNDPDVAIFTGNLAGFRFEPENHPLFFAHGIVPTAEQQIIAGRFKEKLNAGYLHIHGTGMHAGRPCLILRTETLQLADSTFDEFWIDGSRESAVVRSTSFAGNKPSTDTVIEYGKTPKGWLPKNWTFTSFLRGKTHRVWRMKVDELTLEPSFGDADFDIEIRPGMRVREVHFPDSPNPLYVPHPETTDYIQRESQIGSALFRSLGLRSRWLWIGLGLCVVAAVLSWILCRHQKAGASL
jgi:hypothetical protein